MAKNKVYKFRDITQMQYFLNGGIEGGVEIKAGLRGLVGKTLIFTSPGSHTVTFTATSNVGQDPTLLTLPEIAAQIAAVATGVTAASHNGCLVLVETVPTSGVAINGSGTANVLLGFDGTGVTGKVYTPPGVTAGSQQWTWAYSVNENSHTVFTYE